ncbi:MAG: hypothetical protein ACPG1C_07865 [Alphaproteobacteria bacterium]
MKFLPPLLAFLMALLIVKPGIAANSTTWRSDSNAYNLPDLLIYSVTGDEIKKIRYGHYRVILDGIEKGNFIMDLYMSDEVHPTDRTNEGEPLYHHIRQMVITLKGQDIVIVPPPEILRQFRYIDVSSITVSSIEREAMTKDNYKFSLSFEYGTYARAKKCMLEKGHTDDPRRIPIYQDSVNFDVGPKGVLRITTRAEC